MSLSSPKITLKPCAKGYTFDLDKAVSPQTTLEKVKAKFAELNLEVLDSTQRIDVGRLNIPVYLSFYGRDALEIVPTHKQMGKGSSPAQAEASAIMELVERFSFFSFFENPQNFKTATYSEAKSLWPNAVISLEELLFAVNDNLDLGQALEIMDLVPWKFSSATNLSTEKISFLPLNFFRILNAYNGSSAGNTQEESLLQGLSEIIERHVCAKITKEKLTTPTLIINADADPTLLDLIDKFKKAQIELILKDFSLDYPLPTIGAIAYDLKTFPERSEIVFTAGTASSAQKAAIRAITEIAQLGGDFCTSSCYEASGLPKYSSLEEIKWLKIGPTKDLASVKSLLTNDIKDELLKAIYALKPYQVYALDLTHPKLGICANYVIVPGFDFLQRDNNLSLGLLVGRLLVEGDLNLATSGLKKLAKLCGDTHFMPFYFAMLNLRANNLTQAFEAFKNAENIQPDAESKGLCCFYAGYTLVQDQKYSKALDYLQRALEFSPDLPETYNLLGVANFKLKDYAAAKLAFTKVLGLNKGSAMDIANLGLCEKFLGEFDQAKEHLEIALKLDPSIEFAKSALQELKS